jgi:hypothetical protein
MPRPISRARRESALEARAVKYARTRGVVVAKLTQLVGVPDRIFFVPGGRPLIIEFKARGLAPEGLQSWYLKKLTKDSYRAVSCDTWEKFLALMEKCGLRYILGAQKERHDRS